MNGAAAARVAALYGADDRKWMRCARAGNGWRVKQPRGMRERTTGIKWRAGSGNAMEPGRRADMDEVYKGWELMEGQAAKRTREQTAGVKWWAGGGNAVVNGGE